MAKTQFLCNYNNLPLIRIRHIITQLSKQNNFILFPNQRLSFFAPQYGIKYYIRTEVDNNNFCVFAKKLAKIGHGYIMYLKKWRISL